MSEIQSVTDIGTIKYIVGGFSFFISVINALIIYIFSLVKKDIDAIKKTQKEDHDILHKINAEHGIFHTKHNI